MNKDMTSHFGQASPPGALLSAAGHNKREPGQRFLGVDLARLLAIVGMIASHLIVITAALPDLSSFDVFAVNTTEVLAVGISAPLFAVLGGMSMVFATRKLLADGRSAAAVFSLMLRGLVILLIGLLLALTQVNVIIVLVYFGLAMILAAGAIVMPTWLVATVASALAAVVPFCNALLRAHLSVVSEGGSLSFDAFATDPFGFLRATLLTGQYPALTWVVYMLAGIIIARLLMGARTRQSLRQCSLIIAAIGVGVATVTQAVSTWVVAHIDLFVGGQFTQPNQEILQSLLRETGFGAQLQAEPWMALVATPHTGSLFDILRTLAIAAAIIGLLTALCDARVPHKEPGVLLSVLQRAGAAPLTVYSLHIIATAVLLNPTIAAFAANPAVAHVPWYAAGVSGFALQITGVIIIGIVLYVTKKRGPLEALLAELTRLATTRRRTVTPH